MLGTCCAEPCAFYILIQHLANLLCRWEDAHITVGKTEALKSSSMPLVTDLRNAAGGDLSLGPAGSEAGSPAAWPPRPAARHRGEIDPDPTPHPTLPWPQGGLGQLRAGTH